MADIRPSSGERSGVGWYWVANSLQSPVCRKAEPQSHVHSEAVDETGRNDDYRK